MSVLHVIGADSIVREDWLLDVVARLQGTLGSAAFEGTESGALRAAASDLPLPVNRLEELLLGGLLLEIAVGGRGLTVNDLQERARRVAEAFTRAPGLSVAQRAASEICRTYQLPLKVAGLAERLGCEKTCLRRQFQNEYGTTLRDYHLRARIQAAVKLIGTGAVKISAVAVSVGYCSDKNFGNNILD